MKEMKDKFDTKRGSAVFTPDSIRFSESTVGYYKSLYTEYWMSDSVKLKLMFLAILASFPVVFFSVLGIVRTSEGYEMLVIILALFIILFIVQYLRGYRSPDEIRLDDIDNVSVIEGTSPFTRPRFIIEYTDSNSAVKRRVNMPSLYTPSGRDELDRAKKMFEDRGLL